MNNNSLIEVHDNCMCPLFTAIVIKKEEEITFISHRDECQGIPNGK